MKKDKHGRNMPNVAALDRPAQRFWEHVEQEQIELALSSQPDKYADFLNALHAVNFADLSMPMLMRKFNISLHELQVLYTDHMRHLGLLKMSSDLPQVMSDVADDAKNRMILCPQCEGNQVIQYVVKKKTLTRKCPTCEGEGRVLERGDKHARDLVFESMKLTKTPGGPLVAIQQNFGQGGDGLDSKMENMMKLTQQITLGSPNREGEPL